MSHSYIYPYYVRLVSLASEMLLYRPQGIPEEGWPYSIVDAAMIKAYDMSKFYDGILFAIFDYRTESENEKRTSGKFKRLGECFLGKFRYGEDKFIEEMRQWVLDHPSKESPVMVNV